MYVCVDQWRAAIGCFRQSLAVLRLVSFPFQPFVLLFLILKLYLFCRSFISLSILALPIAVLIQVVESHTFDPNFSLLPLVAQLHSLTKIVLYVALEIFKRTPFYLLRVFHRQRSSIKYFLFSYNYIFMICMTFHILQSQWYSIWLLLLSGDIEQNPGPDSLNFCTWNLNSIRAHYCLRISLLEAYNSVYNYDLIGIVETHLNSTVDENKIGLNGYSFHKSNHLQDVKREGVGLYMKESLPARRRPDLETQPECVVCEIKLNRKKYFFAILYRSPSQTQVEFEGFRQNFEQMLSKMSAENPFSVIITGDFNCRSTQW